MNIPQAIARLKKLGFDMSHETWGTIEAEPYDVGKNHFTPRWRDVFLGKCLNGYYVTSHIKGMMRHYRCRQAYEVDIGNIFGGGATLKEAFDKWEANFRNKVYNTQANPSSDAGIAACESR